MPVVEKLGAALADKVRPLGAATVISPAMGGLVIGQEVARQLAPAFHFRRRKMTTANWSCAADLPSLPAKKSSSSRTSSPKAAACRKRSTSSAPTAARALGVAMIVDRSNGEVTFGVPAFSLISLKVEAFAAGQIAARPGHHPRRQTGEQMIAMAYDSFGEFLGALEKAGELKRITQPVATELEITELADREMKSPGGGKALLIEKPTIEGQRFALSARHQHPRLPQTHGHEPGRGFGGSHGGGNGFAHARPSRPPVLAK